MILKDLYDLYELKREGDSDSMPERYWCRKGVSWEVVIDNDGTPVSVVSLAGENGKGTRQLCVPDVQRTSGVRPFFLCDNAEYILGRDEKRSDKKRGDKKRGEIKQEQFVALHEKILRDVDDVASNALISFLKRLIDGQRFDVLEIVAEDPKTLMVFRLVDDVYVHERAAVRSAWYRYREECESGQRFGACLVTGKVGSYAQLYPQVTGLPGGQSSGASLVSCNADAFSSYGQKLSTAGFISADAADKSGAALTYVLKDQSHHVRMGNDHIAFWTDALDSGVDRSLAFFIDPDSIAMGEDERTRDSIQTSLIELRKGKPPIAIPEGTQYHLLGIAPYQARLAVRFYETGSLGELQKNVTQFLMDTELGGVKPCSMRGYLEQTAVQGEAKNLPLSLVTSCMRAMVHNRPFPRALMQMILGRMSVDHGAKKPWDLGRRAAILKACLIRSSRARGAELGREMERSLTVGLNCENNNQGYLLGRLFALLEKAQLDAIGGANATIRDRFMGAAATTPARVYPQLLKLAQHHISKCEYGGYIDRQIQEVISLLGDDGFPKTLSFDDQGLFYIGYYQQRQALYAKKVTTSNNDSEED